ncbi:MAG: DUF2849 domain-containing protein [Alphaproteobacteria bacterium]
MARQIVTANRLGDGAVVFRTADGGWSTEVAAAFAADEQAGDVLKAAEVDARRQIVVGPYLIEVDAGPAGPVPILHRERIRAYGPSIVPPGYVRG